MRVNIEKERGLTLTELLITVVILGVIIVPLGNALIGFIRFTSETSRQFSESHDVQIAAAYFAADVQSLGVRDWTTYPYQLKQSVEVPTTPTGGLFPCGNTTRPAVVRLAWDDPDSTAATPPAIRVAYVVVSTATETQLHRLVCTTSSTPASDTTLVHNVDPTTDPSVVCAPTPACDATTVPTTVTLHLSIRNPASPNAFSIALAGQRRQT